MLLRLWNELADWCYQHQTSMAVVVFVCYAIIVMELTVCALMIIQAHVG